MSEQENNNETIQDPIEDNTTENQEETIELSVEEKLSAEVAEAKDKYVRLSAEFDNYRKRTSKERVELIQSAGKDVITKLLSTVDDFDRVLKAMETATDVESIKTGIEDRQ